MICQLCNKPVGSHWTSNPVIGAICNTCIKDDELVQRTKEAHEKTKGRQHSGLGQYSDGCHYCNF